MIVDQQAPSNGTTGPARPCAGSGQSILGPFGSCQGARCPLTQQYPLLHLDLDQDPLLHQTRDPNLGCYHPSTIKLKSMEICRTLYTIILRKPLGYDTPESNCNFKEISRNFPYLVQYSAGLLYPCRHADVRLFIYLNDVFQNSRLSFYHI